MQRVTASRTKSEPAPSMTTIGTLTKEPRSSPEIATRTTGTLILAVLGVLAASLTVSLVIRAVHIAFPVPEKAVLATGLIFGALLVTIPAVYLLRLRWKAQPGMAGLLLLAGTSVLLLGCYFYWVASYVFFPADILIWSEGDFVNDTIKFSVGYPIYSPQVNNDSFTYVPGAQLLTYLLAWIVGKASSIQAYRTIQVAYTAVAAFLGLLCCRRLLRLAGVGQDSESWLWNALRYGLLLLMATNSITNPFTHNLNGDALAQLASLTGYYLLLVYIERPNPRLLAAMTLVAPLGFLVKQSVMIWLGWYGGFLLFFERNWKRAAIFAFTSAALLGAAIGTCYFIWGEPFLYWVFHVLGAHGVSPLRSFQHVLDAWAYFAGGLLGGAAVLRGKHATSLLGAWLIWLGLITTEAYTSGIAWMLNHIGPGCLIAGVWFLAGLSIMWNRLALAWELGRIQDWITAGAVTCALALAFHGMGLVRIPVTPVSADAYRYVNEIEAQFAGIPANKVLLDAGSWVYLKNKVVMGDRAPSIGERGYSETGDFSGILSRIRQKRYAKILVRDFHEQDFWYDHSTWARSSGIRQTLIDNYREAGHIRAVKSPLPDKDRGEDPYLFGEITILEPKTSEL